MEQQLTHGPGGRILTHAQVWSADSQWLAYDTRSDAAGSHFDGTEIRIIHVESGEVRTVYQSQNGAACGVVTWHPNLPQLVLIHGPEHPTSDWTYSPSRRDGRLLDLSSGRLEPLDARDLVPPFTPGAHRGGTHVHLFHPSADRLSSTYEDEHLRDGQRNILVHFLGELVAVPATHPRNQSGFSFSMAVTQTVAEPRPGSDEIGRACEESWLGASDQLAFQGTVVGANGERWPEVFMIHGLPKIRPEIPTPQMGKPLQPPGRVQQQRLTDTSRHRFPGIFGPRHWLRSNHTGEAIGLLKRDERGVVQFWTVSPQTGALRQVTFGEAPIQSAFTWHPDGERVALVRANRVCVVEVRTGRVHEITSPSDPPPRPEACVISPNGKKVAYVRRINEVNQLFVVDC